MSIVHDEMQVGIIFMDHLIRESYLTFIQLVISSNFPSAVSLSSFFFYNADQLLIAFDFYWNQFGNF